MHTCIRTNIHIHIRVYMYMHTYTHVYISIYVYTHTCLYICTGVCLLCAELLQSCPTLQPFDCSLPGVSVHGILQARILEWVCHFLLQGIFLTQGSNPVSLKSPALAGRLFTTSATREALYMYVCVCIYTHTPYLPYPFIYLWTLRLFLESRPLNFDLCLLNSARPPRAPLGVPSPAPVPRKHL